MSGEDKLEDLRQRRREARQTGGSEVIAARKRAGVLSARERVEGLLDEDTFVELDVFVPGAVTGHGMIAGRDVYVFSEDGEVRQDAGAGVLTQKLNKVADLALTNGAPLIGIYDSGRAEAAQSLGGLAVVARRVAEASGVIPQIAVVLGPVFGSAAYAAVLSDLVIMAKGSGQLFLGDPSGAKASGLEKVAGARVLSEKAGAVHVACDDEAECLLAARRLLSCLPQNNLDDAPLSDVFDPVDRMDAELDSLACSTKASDVRTLIGVVFDKDSFVEVSPAWGPAMVAGFVRLGGRGCGVVGNQPTEDGGAIDADSACKAARFVRLCDAFNLPVITLVDTPGVAKTQEASEQGRLLLEAAKLLYAYAEATVPKLTLVTGRAYAEGFEVMCPKHLKADLCFGWPTARIGVSAEFELVDTDTDAPYRAARAGHLDDVIDPVVSRPRLIAALEACVSKRENLPAKKHGNIPL
jgi:acetyl-CoA carboxylase carboxyltransferase component